MLVTPLFHNHVGAMHDFSRSWISCRLRITKIARWKIFLDMLSQTCLIVFYCRCVLVVLMIVVVCRCPCEVLTVVSKTHTRSVPALRPPRWQLHRWRASRCCRQPAVDHIVDATRARKNSPMHKKKLHSLVTLRYIITITWQMLKHSRS